MYCDRCGKQVDTSLKFCNGCGAQLKKDDDDTPKSLVASLITALIVVATVGLGLLVGLVAVLLDKVQRFELVFVFAFLYLAVLFSICFMVMRQISKLIDAKLKSDDRLPAPAPLSLPATNTAQLEAFHEPASVTEHTTRTLERVPANDP